MTAERAGAARIQGRFQHPIDGFVLRDGLGVKGHMPVSTALDEVLANWERQGEQGFVKKDTVQTHSGVLKTLKSFLEHRGVRTVAEIDSDHVLVWMFAPAARSGEHPTTHMTAQRRSVVRTVYKTFALLGITDLDITTTLPKVLRPQRAVAALTESDIVRLKDFAEWNRRVGHDTRGETKTTAAVALALLGVQTPEIANVRVMDVRLMDQMVWAHGGGDRYRPRWVPISDSWAFGALTDRVAYLVNRHGEEAAASMPLAYQQGTRRGGKGRDNPSASVCNTIDKAMVRAGLKIRKRVRVASITEYVAMREWKVTGRVEAVAALLGMSSLDGAAHLVGYDWREAFAYTPAGVTK